MAKPVAVVTDSTASIPPELGKSLGITVAANILVWEGRSLRDGVDIDPQAFYEKLRDADEHPTTAQVPPGEFGAIFDRHLSAGYDVLAVLMSKKVSGTVESARMAKNERPDSGIRVIDSGMSGMGCGWLAILAARLANTGADLAQCSQIVENALDKVGVLGMLDTLKYLHRSGRIGGARRYLGAMLNMKALLQIADGEIQPLDRVRTRRKALDRLRQELATRTEGLRPLRVAVMHANVIAVAESVREQIQLELEPDELLITDLSPTLGTNFGEGTIGLCYMAGVP